jgi:hypothetical protein
MITKDYKEEHDLVRKELWISIASAYVNSSNSTSKEGAAKWADKVLEDFDSRFKKPKD